MDEKTVELSQRQLTHSDSSQQQQQQEDDSVVTELVKEENLSWGGFACLVIWCAIPCVVYILLFTVSPFVSRCIWFDLTAVVC